MPIVMTIPRPSSSSVDVPETSETGRPIPTVSRLVSSSSHSAPLAGTPLLRKTWRPRRRVRRHPAHLRNGTGWARRFVPRRRRPKNHHGEDHPPLSLNEPLQVPSAIRHQIVDLLALALIE